MGLEDEVARQEEYADSHLAARRAEYEKALVHCREFAALVARERIRPQGYYYRKVGERAQPGSSPLPVYRREGVYWTVGYQADGPVLCAINHVGEPLLLGGRNTRHSFDNSPLVAFDGPTASEDAREFAIRTLQDNPTPAESEVSYHYTEQRLAICYREAEKKLGRW